MKKNITQLEILNFLKLYGFVYPNSEIYNGLSNSWDYGNIGVLLKKNIKDLWWSNFVTKDSTVAGIDTSIIYNSNVWKASGHLENFSDPLIDCKHCKIRIRADKLIAGFDNKIEISENDSNEILTKIINDKNIKCPSCNNFDWTPIRKFNLMFKTFQGVTEDDLNTLYLRPETAQGIFINFKNFQRTSRMKLPFGIAQIGKSFRNEITPGNFIFRTREFEQMEIEYFCIEESSDSIFNSFQKKLDFFLKEKCGLSDENLRVYNHPKEKLSHYSKKTIDFEFKFPHGWGELCGLANRGNFDLTVHEKNSKKDLTYLDPETNEKFLPNVIEPSIGVERLFYAIITNLYNVEEISNGETREVLYLPLALCPYKISVLPLTSKLKDESYKIYEMIIDKNISAIFDNSGSIGKRYRRQDAIGTMYCLTFDFDSLDKQIFTIRKRDTMEQIKVNKEELNSFLLDKILLGE